MKLKLILLSLLSLNFLASGNINKSIVSNNDEKSPKDEPRNQTKSILIKNEPSKTRAIKLNYRDKDKVKDWDNHEIMHFGLFHRARVKYRANEGKVNSTTRDTSTVFAGGGLTIGRWDWILPSSDLYCYVEGTGAFKNLFRPRLPTAGMFEACYGGFFGDYQKKIRWGMGCGFGFRMFYVQTPSSGIRGAAYGMLWPEVVCLIRTSDFITIMPKYIFCPMVNNGLMGLRTSAEVMVNMRLAGFIGVNMRLTSESMFFNNDLQTSNGEGFDGRAKNYAIQFGISFNSSIKDKPKAKRD